MKRLLALCLSVLLVVGAAPVTFAEDTVVTVPATGEVYLEAEDYTSVNVYATEEATEPDVQTASNIKSNASYHGGSRSESNFGGNYKVEINIPISVETTGTYYITFRTIAEQVDRVANSALSIDGTEIMAVPKSTVKADSWVTLEFPVELEAGERTLTFTGYQAEYTTSNLYMFWDYIRISDTREATAIAESGTTVFQAEEYPILEAETTYSTADEMLQLSDTLKTTDASGAENLFWNKVITVAKDGVYILDFSMIGNGNYTSKLYGLVDGELLVNSSGASDSECSSNKAAAYLKAGTHTLTIKSSKAAYTENNRFQADYVSIAPVESVEIAGRGVTTINATDFPYALAYNDDKTFISIVQGQDPYGLSGQEAVRFVLADTDADTSTGDYVEWTVPVTAEKSGIYEAVFSVAGGSGFYSCSKRAIVNRTEVGTAGGSWNAVATITANVTLNAGTNEIGIRSYARGSGGDNDFEVVSVTLENTQPDNPEAVSITEETKFEAENYRWITRVDADGNEEKVYADIKTSETSNELTDYSGDGWLRYDGYKHSKVYSTIDINIPEEGMYELTYYVRNSGRNSSTNNLLIDNSSIYTMPTSSDNWGDFGTYSTKHLFTKGAHTLGYEANGISSTNNCYFAYDYISIKPLEPVAIAQSGVTTINASDYTYALAYNDDNSYVGRVPTATSVVAGTVRFLLSDTDGDKSNKDYAEWIVLVTSEKTTTYTATFSVAGGAGTTSSSKRAIVNGTEVGTAGGKWNAITTITADVTLNAGVNKIGIRSYARSADGVNDFEVMSVTLENTQPANPGAVDIIEETKFEAEDYRWIKIVDSEGAVTDAYIPDANIITTAGEDENSLASWSGDAWVRYNATGYSKAYSTIDINITEDGVYELTYYVRNSGKNSSTNYLLVDGASMYTMPKTSDGYGDFATHTVKHIFTKGAHTIGYEANTPGNGNCYFAYDYISIKPTDDAATVTATGVTTLKATDYLDALAYDADGTLVGKATATAKTFDGTDAVQFGFGDADGDKATDDYLEWIVPINVEEAGVYTITFSVQGGSSAYVNAKKALVNGTEVEKAGGSNSSLTTITNFSYFTAGANSVGIRAYSRSADGGFDVTIDGITIEKNKPKEYEAATISGDSVTYIEAEDYDTFKTDTEGHDVYGTVPDLGPSGENIWYYEGAHGTGEKNCIRWNAYGYEYVSFDIPITVEKSGMYMIDFNSGCSCSYTGTQELYLDGELFLESKVYSNKSADAFISTLGHDKYFEAGSYTLTIKSTKTEANPNCYYYTDYVSFKPVSFIEESATAGTYDVTVVYDEPVSGIIAAAAYNKDNKLLATTKIEATNSTRFEFQLTDVPTDEALRVIKLFAWDTECNPQDVRQDIFYQPVDTDPFAGDDEINIVYIGGSLTAGAGSTFGGWVGLASEYFKEKHGADKVVNHNVGIGGTTSQYGMFRLAQDVVSKNPDMVFIEFVLNDGGTNAARGAAMETMVRTLLEMDKVPYINFVYTKYPGKNYIVPHYHTLVARHYGIPEIYVKGSYVDDETEETYYRPTDLVHPNDTGYRAWYAEIEKCLVTDKYYQRPIVKNDAVFEESGVLMASTIDKFTFEQSGSWTEDTTYNRLSSSTVGDSLSFSFTGNSIAFIISGSSKYGNYSITIDGVNKGTFAGTETGWDQMGQFFTNLSDGPHNATITIEDRNIIDAEKGTYDVPGTFFCLEDIFVGDLIG